jgi:hypothetical protein
MLCRSRQVSFMRQRRKYSRTSPETCTSDILFIATKIKIFSFNKNQIRGLWLKRELLQTGL